MGLSPIIKLQVYGSIWKYSANFTVELLKKKLELLERPFRCFHNSTFFSRADFVELHLFS